MLSDNLCEHECQLPLQLMLTWHHGTTRITGMQSNQSSNTTEPETANPEEQGGPRIVMC